MAVARSTLAIVTAFWLAADTTLDTRQGFAQQSASHAAPASPVYPLKVSDNNRYLVDQSGAPFLMVGDSPQSLIGNLSLVDIAFYLENRARHGINALWVNLLCNAGTACNADGTTFDGVPPFTTAGDLSTPNPAYFARVDEALRIADANGIVVLLNPIETIGWLGILRQNGIAKARAYGEFLGTRYRDFPNIIWMHGNDFQSWRDTRDKVLVQAVARGIRSAAPAHLHTIELNYLTSGSLDDPGWRTHIELDAAYSYYPSYAQILKEYNRFDPLPTFLVEANYEFERNPDTDGGALPNLRRQAYWTMLSGATGQLYGSAFTWRFPADWKEHLDSPGIRELTYMSRLFGGLHWWDLVPDQAHDIVTAGFGTFNARGSIASDTYVTAAATPSGDLMVAYLPTARTITIDMSRLPGVSRARWYDPTNGVFQDAEQGPAGDQKSRHFTPPQQNATGHGDWILILDSGQSDNHMPN